MYGHLILGAMLTLDVILTVAGLRITQKVSKTRKKVPLSVERA